MAKRRKRRYYDAYQTVKGLQHITAQRANVIKDWEIDDMMINNRDHLVNKRKRSRIGLVDGRRPR